jgi:hypothetical protein
MAPENPGIRVMMWLRQVLADRFARAAFDLHVASLERPFSEPRRFKRELYKQIY